MQTGPRHGKLALNANGSYTYTPDADFNGSDSFTYVANDGKANSNVATVNITIIPVNDAPTVKPIADQTVRYGTTLTVPINATDKDGDKLSFSAYLLVNNQKKKLPDWIYLTKDASGNYSLVAKPLYKPYVGTYKIGIDVTDSSGKTTTVSFLLTVKA